MKFREYARVLFSPDKNGDQRDTASEGAGKTTPSSGFSRLLASFLGVVAVVGLPLLHFSLLHRLTWKEKKFPVDQSTCSCNCWDMEFKGDYETGIATYKHVYFNLTSNTLLIWVCTVVAAVAFYESVRRIVLLLLARRLRFSMFALFAVSVYPNYYTWWMHFNYLNDEFYRQIYHQSLFTASELIVTVITLHLMDKKEPLSPAKLTIVLMIGLAHCLAAWTDQFFSNVLMLQGKRNQVMRDMVLMAGDLLNVLVSSWYLVLVWKGHSAPPKKLLKFVFIGAPLVILMWSLTFLL